MSKTEPGSQLSTLTLAVGGVALLWGFRYLPMQDLPNHIAISDYTVRLWRGEPEASRFYQLQLFAPTYRLYYILAAPFSAALGAVTGARVMITLIWIGHVGACHALVRAAGLRPWVVLALAPWFFSMQFFTGLLPSLLASVLVLWAVWALLRLDQTGRRRWSILAALFGMLAVAAHVITAVLWLAALAAYGVLSVRRRWRLVALMAGVSLLPGIIWLPLRMAEQSVAPAALLGSMRYLTPTQYVRWLLPTSLVSEWSASAGRIVLLAGAVVFAALLGRRFLREPDTRQPAATTAIVTAVCAAWWFAFLLTPNHSALGGVWVINVRYVESAMLLTTLLAAHYLTTASPRVERTALAGVVLAVTMQGAGLYRAFERVDREYAAIDDICAAIPFGSTLTTSQAIADAFGTNVSMAYHAHGYCAVGVASYDAAVFQNVHMPVRATPPAIYARSPSAEVGAYDYLLFDNEAQFAAPPSDGVLVVESGRWRLYQRVDSSR